jgi:hypothetical protein
MRGGGGDVEARKGGEGPEKTLPCEGVGTTIAID